MTNVGKCGLCGAIKAEDARFCSTCGGRFKAQNDRYDGFISYRREGGSHIATLLKLSLETGFGKRFFLDVDELQVGRFDEKLLKIISDSPNFVLVLSSGSLERCVDKNDWLKREIMYALEAKRNIIPILVDSFTFPGQQIMDLLPEAMRTLPNFQAVAYSHLHRESAVRRVAEYCVDSIIPDEAVAASEQLFSDVEWLLFSRAEIEHVNRDAFSDTEVALDQQSGPAIPIAIWCITEQWNKNKLVVEKEDLRRQVETVAGLSFNRNSWSALCRCLAVGSPSKAQTRTLMLTPKTDLFAIDYPRLAALWNSQLGKAIKTTLGLAPNLRTPSPGAELQWIEWMTSLEESSLDSPASSPREPATNPATVDTVYSPAERSKIAAGMTTLEKLPPNLRPTVSEHVGKEIAEKRRALMLVRDQPGNRDAYAYIGLLFYWDLIRIARDGTEEQRQIIRNAIWTEGSQQIQGYLSIALYFLRRYLEIAPDGSVRNDAANAITWLEGIRESAQQFSKE